MRIFWLVKENKDDCKRLQAIVPEEVAELQDDTICHDVKNMAVIEDEKLVAEAPIVDLNFSTNNAPRLQDTQASSDLEDSDEPEKVLSPIPKTMECLNAIKILEIEFTAAGQKIEFIGCPRQNYKKSSATHTLMSDHFAKSK